MVLTIENILLIGSLLLFISLIAGKTSYEFGIPTLILFLVIGMLARSEGIGRLTSGSTILLSGKNCELDFTPLGHYRDDEAERQIPHSRRGDGD